MRGRKIQSREDFTLFVNLKTHDARKCSFFLSFRRSWSLVEATIEEKVLIRVNCCLVAVARVWL